MPATQVRGIAAAFAGKCQLCGTSWDEGDLIEKIPGVDPPKRGHALCVANMKAGRPAQMQQHPDPQYAPQQNGAAAPQAHQPSINGGAPDSDRGAIALGNTRKALFDTKLPTQLWYLADGLSQIAAGALRAMGAVEQIARLIDPHDTQKPPRERPDFQ